MKSDESWSDSSTSGFQRPVARKRPKPKKPKNVPVVQQEISINSTEPKKGRPGRTRKLYKDSQDQTALSEDMWNFWTVLRMIFSDLFNWYSNTFTTLPSTSRVSKLSLRTYHMMVAITFVIKIAYKLQIWEFLVSYLGWLRVRKSIGNFLADLKALICDSDRNDDFFMGWSS